MLDRARVGGGLRFPLFLAFVSPYSLEVLRVSEVLALRVCILKY